MFEYTCANCGEPRGMYGHYIWTSGDFTCEPNNVNGTTDSLTSTSQTAAAALREIVERGRSEMKSCAELLHQGAEPTNLTHPFASLHGIVYTLGKYAYENIAIPDDNQTLEMVMQAIEKLPTVVLPSDGMVYYRMAVRDILKAIEEVSGCTEGLL